jgi:hypothetical protein
MREGQELGAALQLLATFRQSASQAEGAVVCGEYGGGDDADLIVSYPPMSVAEERAVNAAADFLEAYFQRGTAAILQPRS